MVNQVKRKRNDDLPGKVVVELDDSEVMDWCGVDLDLNELIGDTGEREDDVVSMEIDLPSKMVEFSGRGPPH